MPAAPVPTSAAAIRGRLVDTLRWDLSPGPADADLARERLKYNPSRWYLSGFLAPALDGIPEGTESLEDEGDPLLSDEFLARFLALNAGSPPRHCLEDDEEGGHRGRGGPDDANINTRNQYPRLPRTQITGV
jgi:hypothetical protein